MNPKIKLLVLLVAVASTMIYPEPFYLAVLAIAAFALILKTGIHHKFALWLKPMALVFAIIVVMNSITFSPVGFGVAGVLSGILYGARVLILVAIVFLFVQTSGMTGLASAFSFLPRVLSQVMVLSLALIPTVTDLAQKILNAQKARGLSFRSLNLLRTYFPVLVPLFAKTLDRSDKLALAMQARGYGG